MAEIDQIAIRLEITGLKPLRNDASTRQYWRYKGGVLMLDQGDGSSLRREKFIDVAVRLRNAGQRAPVVYAHEEEIGVILMEDFGNKTLAQNVDHKYYARALENLLKFENVDAMGLTHYHFDIYAEEVSRLNRYYLSPLGVDNTDFISIAKPYFDALSQQASRFVHVDYHAENLMICADDELGILDFQDARFGHALYDLASLVDDIRIDIPKSITDELLQRGLDALKIKDAELWFHVISVQRLMKIIGIFARLTGEGRTSYEVLIPRCFEIIKTRLEHPELKLWKQWFYEIVPNYSPSIGTKLKVKK